MACKHPLIPGHSGYGQLVLLKQTGRLRFSGAELPHAGSPGFLPVDLSIDRKPAVAAVGDFAHPTFGGRGWFWFVEWVSSDSKGFSPACQFNLRWSTTGGPSHGHTSIRVNGRTDLRPCSPDQFNCVSIISSLCRRDLGTGDVTIVGVALQSRHISISWKIASSFSPRSDYRPWLSINRLLPDIFVMCVI